MGKGDRYRKVNQDKFNENFDKIFNKRGNKMSKQYIYEASEQSVDVRSWTIKSDRQLTEDEVTEIYQDSQIDDEGEEQEYSTGIPVTFEGTEYMYCLRFQGVIMSYSNDFKEQHQDEINEEWYEYCHEIQQVRRKYNLPDLVFTQGDKDFFAQKYIERRLN